MKLVVIFLNQIEYLEELLSIFLEIGVSGATVLDSMGMGHIISENIPIFAGLRDAFAGSSPGRKIIMAITEEEMIERMYHALDEVCNSESDKKTSFLISLPIDKIYGLNI
jgi:nitrogen regulatory protein P-II 1